MQSNANILAEKGQFEKWDLLIQAQGLSYGLQTGQLSKKTVQHAMAHEYTVAELALLGNTVCAECSGFGHVSKDCPTKERLTTWGSYGGTHSHMIAGARQCVQRKYGHGLQMGGHKSTLSKTPRCTPRKRA